MSKKLNKIARTDAQRYHNALLVRDEVYAKVDANPAYHQALVNELDKLEAIAKPAVAVKTSSGPSLKTIGLLVVGAVILHETGYDAIIWNKVKSFGRQARAKAQEVVDENPEVAQAASNVKEAVVDLKDEVKEKVQEATTKTDYTKEPGAGI